MIWAIFYIVCVCACVYDTFMSFCIRFTSSVCQWQYVCICVHFWCVHSPFVVDYDPRCCGSFCSHLSYEEDHEVLKDACVSLSKRHWQEVWLALDL